MSGALYHHWTEAVPGKKVCSQIRGECSMKLDCSFLCLPKETNQRKGPLCLLSRRRRDARSLCPAWGTPQSCRDVANSLRSNSANPLFGSLSGARLRANGNFPPPHLSCRVPPSARSKGSPQGQDWLGCLFLVFSFGHAKEERAQRRKAIFVFPGISGGIPTQKGRTPNRAPAFLYMGWAIATQRSAIP